MHRAISPIWSERPVTQGHFASSPPLGPAAAWRLRVVLLTAQLCEIFREAAIAVEVVIAVFYWPGADPELGAPPQLRYRHAPFRGLCLFGMPATHLRLRVPTAQRPAALTVRNSMLFHGYPLLRTAYIDILKSRQSAPAKTTLEQRVTSD